jgi:5'-nucleotidase
MRNALIALALLFAAACATSPASIPAKDRPAGHFRILHINDVYKIEGLESGASGGLARVRWLRDHLANDGTPVLVLHGGDALYPSVMSKYLEAKPMVDVLNLLDGDPAKADSNLLVTLGNHELDNKDGTTLIARLNDSQFSWIATNTLYCKTPDSCGPFRDAARNISETSVLDVGGVKVGFFGILYSFTKPYAKSTAVTEAATHAVDVLRKSGARIIIAITHQNAPDDVAMVQSVPGIDLVVGGHDHLYSSQKVGNTWVSKADADAKSVIVYDVVVTESGALKTAPVRMVLDTTVPKDPQVDAAVQGWLTALSAKLGGNTTIGQTKYLLEGVEPAVRGRETALGNLLADAARDQMQTDIGFMNGGGIRINDNIPPGPITKYDMEGVFYYANSLVAFEATGAQIVGMLNNAVSLVDVGDGRFLQVSGLRFKYHQENGKYVVRAGDVTVGGAPLDPAKKYSVVTIDYMYTSGCSASGSTPCTGDGYELFSNANRPPKINTAREADFRTVTEAYIKQRGTIDTNVDGRIVRE